MQTGQMAQIFLSYSRKDGNDYVAEVQRELETRGYATWRDVRNLHPDQDFTADIEAGIAESSHVVVCITQDTLRNNSFVRREIQYALAIKKPVIPLRCHDTVPHISIINNEWVDYFRDRVQAVQRLTEILNDPRLQNAPGDQPADPFRPYLEAALQSIVTGLQQRIIRQIDLRSKATPDAVNAPERKTQAKPVDIFQLAMSGVKMGGDEEPEKAEEKTDFETFAEAFEYYHHRVLLMGQAGAGKTITLMAHAREAYAARLEDPTKPLPLFGLIPTWNSETQPSLADWLAETYQLNKEGVRQVLGQGRALLLLDGLDELGRERPVDPEKPDGEKYDPRLRFIKALPANTQILMTSRIEDYNDLVARGEQAVLNGAITLQPLGEAQMAAYLADQPELWQLIQEDEQLREITTTPLLMSFFAFAYQDMSAEERTQLTQLENALDLRDRIFIEYIEKRYEHERKKVNADLPFSLEDLVHILGELAMRNAADWQTETNVITATDLESILIGINVSSLMTLALQLHIFVPTQGSAFRFIHLLLRNVVSFKYSILALEDSDAAVRQRAASALGVIGDKRALEPLIAALKDGDRNVRKAAVDGMWNINDKRAVEPLIAALEDGDRTVRESAAMTLSLIGDERAVEPLIAAAFKERDPNIPWGSAESLGMIRGEATIDKTIKLLIPALEDSDAAVRQTAAHALGGFSLVRDERVVEALIPALEDSDAAVRQSAVNSLGRTGNKRVVEPLIAALKDSDSTVRQSAARALGGIIFIRDERVVEPLIAALKDSDSDVRRAAAHAMEYIKDERALEPLIASLRDTNMDVRWRAVIALAFIKDERAVEPLITSLKDTDWRVCRQASTALIQIGTPEALAAVEEWRKQNPNG